MTVYENKDLATPQEPPRTLRPPSPSKRGTAKAKPRATKTSAGKAVGRAGQRRG